MPLWVVRQGVHELVEVSRVRQQDPERGSNLPRIIGQQAIDPDVFVTLGEYRTGARVAEVMDSMADKIERNMSGGPTLFRMPLE
jgi:hypothetical protein